MMKALKDRHSIASDHANRLRAQTTINKVISLTYRAVAYEKQL